MSQKVLQYIEIDIDYCSLTYGNSPCQARVFAPLPTTTKLLLHFDETQGSTIFRDSSPSLHGNATVFGNTQIYLSHLIHTGLGTGLFDGAGDYITFPNSADWEFGNSDFTIDWWEYRTSNTTDLATVTRDGTLVFQAFIAGYSNTALNRLEFYASSNGSTWDIASGLSMGAMALSTWTHRAVVRSGNTFYTFKDGVLQATTTSSATLLASSAALSIGRYNSTQYFPGFLEEFRISKIARWTDNFNPFDAADLPQTGAIKCFNTLATCQDREDFNNIPVTLRFAVPTNYLPSDIECIPNIKEINFDPAVISLGQNLGQRATLTVSFDDHRHSDTGPGFDKYLADSPSSRPYDPYSQGTFWGKFRARQPFLRGRNLRWITGFLGDALVDMETRHYIIDSFSGPDNNGKFQIIAKDLLKLADGDRALAPNVSNGFLVAAITNSQTSLVLSPSEIGNEYPPTGYVAIGGSEICTYFHSGGGTETTITDPYTKLLLHMDYPIDATNATFVDSSPVVRGLATVGGNAQTNTAQKKFGFSSALLDGSGDYLLYPDSADWVFGSGNFTIDCWVRQNALSANYQMLYADGTDGNNFLLFGMNPTGFPFFNFVSGGVTQATATAGVALNLNEWTHLAFVRNGNNFTIYRNGVADGTAASATAIGDYTSGTLIGAIWDGSTYFYNGWIDEYRISKGIARWTSNFTPPSQPYANANTAGASDTFTIVRAQLNTTAAAHSAQDRVQFVQTYTAQSPDLIIAHLLETYADVDPSFIPSVDWSAEVTAYLNRLYTAVIPQPTSVNTLVSELIEQAGLSMWWDDRNQEIGLLVLRGLLYSYVFSEENVVADTFEVAEQPDKRLSQVHTYFGQINPLTSLTDKSNYRSVSRIIDAQAESDYGSPAIKEIFSRWIPALGRTIADRLGTILLARFTDPPRHVKISVLRESTPEIQLAHGYQITSTFLQDETGASEAVNAQVTRLRPAADLIQIEADEVIYTAAAEDLLHRNIIIDANNSNINLRTVHDLLYPVADSTITVICTINAGIKLGSASSGLLSLDIGSWATGVTIVVNVLGDLRGAGGTGGTAAWPSVGAGQPGGTALYTRFPIKLACTGTIWGGGGGGGGATYGGNCGGGGGAGIIAGSGGSAASPGSPGSDTSGGLGGIGAAGHIAATGGGPGLAGGSAGSFVGVDGFFYPGGAGGAAGNKIDGVSFVTKGSWDGTTFTFTPGALGGDTRGPEIN